MNSDHLQMFSDAACTALISYQGSDCHVEKLSPTADGVDLRLNHPIAAAAVFGNTAVALANDVRNNQLEVCFYRFDTDVMDSFAIHDIRYYGRGFCYDGNGLYLVSDRRTDIVERYNVSGVLTDRFSFSSDVLQLGADFRGNPIAVSQNTLYRLNGNRFSACGGANIAAPVSFFTDEMLSDASGNILRVTSDRCDLLFHADSVYGQNHACALNGVVYYPDSADVYGYDVNSGAKRMKITLNQPVFGLYTENGCICALSDNGSPICSRIRPNEFADLRSSETKADTQEQHINASVISSDVYRINFDSYYISGIPAGATLAQLKKNIRHDGYQVQFFRNGSAVKSGNCGTAMTAVFDSDNARYTFELSVVGDLTGEGNVNSRDLTVLMEYLIGKSRFNGVYEISADLSGDGSIDVKDLALLHRAY